MNAPIAYITHPICLQHEMGEGHPEQPNRMRVIETALIQTRLMERMRQMMPHQAATADLIRAHMARYVRVLEMAKPDCGHYIDATADTRMNCHTWDAVLYAAGAGLMAVDSIMAGEINAAFCNIRPPGHHAERTRAMGFCFVNNVAVAALYALDHYRLQRVAIVDFDVHHGNGTEDIFTQDSRVLLCSTFQSPLYPNMGDSTHSEHILNLPLPSGTNGKGYREIFSNRVLPALSAFEPELVLFSAGFDAHKDDPMASLELEAEDYRWITESVIQATRATSRGYISMLEGGYNLDALGASAAQHVLGLTLA